jgi:hypothetical protein
MELNVLYDRVASHERTRVSMRWEFLVIGWCRLLHFLLVLQEVLMLQQTNEQ